MFCLILSSTHCGLTVNRGQTASTFLSSFWSKLLLGPSRLHVGLPCATRMHVRRAQMVSTESQVLTTAMTRKQGAAWQSADVPWHVLCRRPCAGRSKCRYHLVENAPAHGHCKSYSKARLCVVELSPGGVYSAIDPLYPTFATYRMRRQGRVRNKLYNVVPVELSARPGATRGSIHCDLKHLLTY